MLGLRCPTRGWGTGVSLCFVIREEGANLSWDFPCYWWCSASWFGPQFGVLILNPEPCAVVLEVAVPWGAPGPIPATRNRGHPMSRSGASSEGDISSSGDAGEQVPSRASGDELPRDSAAADAVATAKVLCSVSYLVFTGAKLLL